MIADERKPNNILSIIEKTNLNRQDALDICLAVNQYFVDGRPRSFKNAERKIINRIPEIFDHLSAEEGINFIDNFFLLSYNLADDAKKCQIEIHNKICLPYKNWIYNKQINFDVPIKQLKNNELIFITRHAVTSGGYAPGMSTFTFAKAFIEAGYRISIICLGNIDQRFAEFVRATDNVSIHQINENNLKKRFQSVLQKIFELSPSFILTEIEFGIPAVLSIKNFPIPIIYLSPGFYNLPWYNAIGLTDTLFENPVGDKTQNYFEIPTYVDMQILSPPVDIRAVNKIKANLDISKHDFVIGNFARMEKFSTSFLDLITSILQRNSYLKVVLAGPNDKSRVTKKLEDFIREKRVHILGPSDVHVLGHVLDAGIDTFPNHSGFSLNELMAKGIPVFVKWTPTIDSNWKMRLPELIFENETLLLEHLDLMQKNPEIKSAAGKKSMKLMEMKQQNSTFVEIMESTFSSLK